ncbi:hypothetical protein AGLY_018197 [Aphis glycines]|uniref:HAT C-terminal dimerisation domain-containing protein n=1 Tax=Aphis glycines TaxID=307491 RepID=A0A6G0STF1_APHGL|nr:hypothetical protein AGLY_018197 [Aphis glycines]
MSCVDRVLEQYPALEAYLKELVFEDPSKTSNEMLKTMNNCYTKIYLEFLFCVLSLLTEFNILFQSEAPLLYKLKSEVERLLTNIVSNYIELKYVKSLTNIFEVDETNPHHFEKQDNIYIGMEASESILLIKSSTTTQDLDIFYNFCLNFYIELVKDIKSRFNFVVSDPLFDIIQIVDPAHAQSFQTKSLKQFFIRFPILNNIVNQQLAEQEWREHALLNHSTENLDTSISVEDYWSSVFNIKNSVGTPLFNNLKVVIKLLLVLPFSNASVERVFSTLNLCNTAHRNRLKTETLRAIIMTTKDRIKSEKGIVAFNPSKAMLNEKLWS